MDSRQLEYLGAQLSDVKTMCGFVADSAMDFGVDEEGVEELVMAVYEALANVIIHGYQNHAGPIQIIAEPIEQGIRVRLMDSAPTFDPCQMPSPNIAVPLEQRPFGGMGVQMIRSFVDEFLHHELPGGGNELILAKFKPANG